MQHILEEAEGKGMRVSVFRRGQLAFTRGMTLEDLESQIITLEGPQYVDETLGANVIDIDYDKLYDDVESGKTGI